MTYPNNDHSIEQHHREHYPTTGEGIIPKWIKGESKAASKYQREWIDNMTPEEHGKFLKREADYQKSIGNAKYY